MKHIKLFLNNDKYIIKITCFIIVCFVIYTRSFPGTDQLNQFGSSVNFLNGFGFVTKYFDGENLFVRPVNNWPIFYSFFSSLLLFFTKNTVFTLK